MLRKSPVVLALVAASLVSCSSTRTDGMRAKVAFSDADSYDNRLLSFPETKKAEAVAARESEPVRSPASSNAGIDLPGVAPDAHVDGTIPLVAGTDRGPERDQTKETASPDEAYAALIRGNDRFVKGAMERRNQDETRRRALAGTQRPFAIVLSCSDSRVPPELVFDQGLGDLFVVRVAGNILGSAQVASIEYAIEHLGSKLIVVMGHESCGAVKAALTVAKGQAGSTDLNWLVSEIQPNVSKADTTRMPASLRELADPKYRKPVMANVDVVAEALVKRSAIVRHFLEQGKIQFVRGIYGLESGKVDFWGYGESAPKGRPPVTSIEQRKPAGRDAHSSHAPTADSHHHH